MNLAFFTLCGECFRQLSVKHLFHLKVTLTKHIHIAVDIDATHIGRITVKGNVDKLYQLVAVKMKKNIFAFHLIAEVIYNANA